MLQRELDQSGRKGSRRAQRPWALHVNDRDLDVRRGPRLRQPRARVHASKTYVRREITGLSPGLRVVDMTSGG